MINKVGILVIGNEILDGVTLNTNSQWIINRIKPLNYTVQETIIVRDNTEEIGKALNRLIDDGCGIVFTTGGLGPTYDDMTLKGIADGLDIPLELNKEALHIVTRQYNEFHTRGIINTPQITKARKKMAMLPKNSKPLDNKIGGAPGVLLNFENTYVICLPGVPSELKWIFDNQLLPFLQEKINGVFSEKIISLPLRDESTLAPIIDEVMKKHPDVYIKSMVKPYGEKGIRLWISSRGNSILEVSERVEIVEKLLIQLTDEKLPKI